MGSKLNNVKSLQLKSSSTEKITDGLSIVDLEKLFIIFFSPSSLLEA